MLIIFIVKLHENFQQLLLLLMDVKMDKRLLTLILLSIVNDFQQPVLLR